MKTIALVGNPNSGKTTIFNALTGTNQHVGNWPGVTVEKKEGSIVYEKEQYSIIDLPGTYSLGAYSEDELVARDFILTGNHDIIINVLDATNLERNLYLTTQLMEMDAKVVIALNMTDEAEKRHIKIDYNRLSQEMGIPVIPTIASKSKGVDNLIQATVDAIDKDYEKRIISYGKELDEVIYLLKDRIDQSQANYKYPSQWLAIKLLENDEKVMEILRENGDAETLSDMQEKIRGSMTTFGGATDGVGDGLEPEMVIIDKRYEFASKVIKKSVTKPEQDIETTTDKIDRIITHKYWGIPIFAAIMF
ncbi:MAG TPA: ferrous iron transporter B, partial [Clostridia bacterium]|nr:ferrous iron transporter B [Clostridia bacterium]